MTVDRSLGRSLPPGMQFWRESADLDAAGKRRFATGVLSCIDVVVVGGSSKLPAAFCQYRYPSPTGRPGNVSSGSSWVEWSSGAKKIHDFSKSCGRERVRGAPRYAPAQKPSAREVDPGRPIHGGAALGTSSGAEHQREPGRCRVPDLQPGRSLAAMTFLQFGERPCSTRY